MSNYIIDAIKMGILETFEMTFFASILAYVGGLPIGILLYATAKDRILENKPVTSGQYLQVASLSDPAGAFDPLYQICDRILHRDNGFHCSPYGGCHSHRGKNGGIFLK